MTDPAGPNSAAPAEVRHLPLASGREAILWHWSAATADPIGTILFSHGAQSAPWHYDRLIQPWREAGYAVWAPLHVDSTDHPLTADYPGLATWRARLEDMHAAAALIDAPYVAAGHSYGALTALVMGGALGDVPEDFPAPLRDPRARCVLAFSPPPPIPGLISPEGYAGIAVPALIQTGDRDLMPGWPDTGEGWRVHLPAYENALPGGDRYLLVLAGVDHTFGNAICEPTRAEAPQLAALADAVAIAGRFLGAFYPEARADGRLALDARLAVPGPVRLERK